jgi:phosphoglycolate phosphatase
MNMNHKYKLLIFDWDGTLSDSVSRIVHSIQAAATEHDLEVPTFDEAANIIGLGLKEAIIKLFPAADNLLVAKITASYSDSYRIKDAGPSDFFPYALDTLCKLKAEGYKLAVATGKSRAGLNRAFKASDIDDLFHSSRCADETASKPDSLMLAQLLEEFGLEPDQALMVGDTEYDMDMAQRIKMPRLGVSYGAHHQDRLAKYDPVACIDCFSDILKYI